MAGAIPHARGDFQIDRQSYVTVNFESVADSVEHAPNLPSGGFAPSSNRPRYEKKDVSIVRPLRLVFNTILTDQFSIGIWVCRLIGSY